MGRGGIADITLWGVCGFILGSAFSLLWVGVDEEKRFKAQQQQHSVKNSKQVDRIEIKSPTGRSKHKDIQPDFQMKNTASRKEEDISDLAENTLQTKQSVDAHRKELGLDSVHSSPSGYRKRKSIEVTTPVLRLFEINQKSNSNEDIFKLFTLTGETPQKKKKKKKGKNESFPSDLSLEHEVGLAARQQSLDENLSDLFEGITSVEIGLDEAANKLSGLCCSLGEAHHVVRSIEACLGILEKTQSLVHSLGEHTTLTSTQVVNIRDYLISVRDDEGISPGEREVAKWITSSYLQVETDPAIHPRASMYSLHSYTSIDSLESLDNPETSEKIDEEDTYEDAKIQLLFTPALDKIVNTTLGKWNFDIFEFDSLVGGEHTLPVLGIAVYRKLLKLPFVDPLDIPEKVLYNYLLGLSKSYFSREDVPYHNALHAADVMATMLYFVDSKTFVQYDFYAVFSSLLACAAHDVEHNGFTNQFHINSSSDLALRYNDKAVLENHHCAVGWKLLLEKPSILSHIPRPQQMSFRNVFTSGILATDMATHKNQLIQLEDFPKQHSLKEPLASSTQISILPKLLHTADISNVAKPFKICNRWVGLLMIEFFSQGDIEKEQGLTVSPLCDREITDPDASEVAFIKFICDPWFELLITLIPDIASPVMQDLKKNYKLFKGRAFATQQESAVPASSPGFVRRHSVNLSKLKNSRGKFNAPKAQGPN